MTEHTDTRRLQIPTSNMTAADLVAFADDVREAVDGSTPVKVTHRAGIFTPPETILVEIPTAESCDLPGACPPNAQAIAYCVRAWAAGHVVVVVTARMYRWQELSEAWLDEHLPGPYTGPFMRGDLDHRPDVDVKRDIHRILTRDHEFEIVGAIDDNPPIIELWQGLGIPTEVVPREWDQ